MINAQPTPSSAAASTHGAATPSLALLEARQLRDALKLLLRKEQGALAGFLVALADFDRRRGWEPLGHANLFAFLIADLGLSKSAAYYRRSAAELLQRFPEIIAPLGEGKLCLSTVGELAKVLTEENRAVVTPRFFGLSSREAQELVAELQPRHVPSTRMVVTQLFDRSVASPASAAQPLLTLTQALPSASTPPTTLPFGPTQPSTSTSTSMPAPAPLSGAHPDEVPPWRFPTSGIANGGGERTQSPRDDIEPLTADLRRLHITVSRQLLKKLEAAQVGLGHARPGATMEQVIDAAVDLLLEKQARARGQLKKPRGVAATAEPLPVREVVAAPAQPSTEKTPQVTRADPQPGSPPPHSLVPSRPPLTEPSTEPSNEPPPHRRTGPREPIPAAVRRAVWARDGGRCSWPLDGGGRCGSTHRLELDHILPWAMFGGRTEDNLRLLCGPHNKLAARRAFGERCVERYFAGAAARSGQRAGEAGIVWGQGATEVGIAVSGADVD